jgi:mono/diheme cytochrome c family protein
MLKRLFSWPGYQPSAKLISTGNLDEKSMKQFADGRQKYLASCAGCHGNNGKGVSRMGPPVAGSEWVIGDEVRLSLIMLHGLEGPIEVNGKKYDAPDILPVMPSHSTMDDAVIASILTYIRNEWGNEAAPVTGRTVGSTRHLNQGRVYPWSAAELNKHMERLATNAKP